jgi:5'-nucleotidase
VGTRNRTWIAGVTLAAVTAASVAAVAGTTQAQGAPVTVQVLGTNDFHGRLLVNPRNPALSCEAQAATEGGALMSGAVKQLRTQYPNTVFSAAGDLIGASTFESFIAQDKPTLDLLNEAGLEVSAVGNHELDQGYDDLVGRVMAPYDPVTNPTGGALWEYLGANVRNADGSPALPETWIQDFGDVRVGFVGAVTDHLDELVSPAGIAGLLIEEPVVAANRHADELKAAGADIVILLVHEGAATTTIDSAVDPTSDFGRIVTGVNANVDAIISGHTHLAYNHSITVPAWVAEGRPVTTRPVVSAGQYAFGLNQLLFQVDPAGDVVGVTSNLLPLVTAGVANFPADPAAVALVCDAVADAEVLGAQPLGAIAGPFNRAKKPAPPPTPTNPTPPIAEHRGGESTLGNLVAEVQRVATAGETTGSAQIAFMNPGGLRADMTGTAYPSVLTYRQAANVQPFANTLVNMDLTGAQLKTVLEQQWQPTGAARPFLRLGISEGFTYTYDPAAPAGSHITQMWLDGVAIEPTGTYSVTVNSFLATGGDNFAELARGANKRDTGQVDLEAMVDYAADLSPLVPDFTQRSIGISFPPGAPAVYPAGSTVSFAVSSLLMAAEPPAAAGSGQFDTAIAVDVDGTPVGEFPVDNSLVNADVLDENGRAAVSFVLPAGLPAGAHTVRITGTTTGSTTTIPVQTAAAVSTTTLTPETASQVYGSAATATLTATVTVGTTPARGSVVFTVDGQRPTTVALSPAGTATFSLPRATPAGAYTVTAAYAGTPNVVDGSQDSAVVTVAKATSTTILTSTRTTQRKGALLPTLLISGTALDNGQLPQGYVEFRDGTTVVARTASVIGLSWYVVPRSISVGTHSFTATFVPYDTANHAPSTSNAVLLRVTR